MIGEYDSNKWRHHIYPEFSKIKKKKIIKVCIGVEHP